MPEFPGDEDAMIAAVDLIGRTGARDLETGYLHDDVPVEQAGWYATAHYQGTKIIAENHPGPIEALESLARQLLNGGICTHCGRRITLSRAGRGKACRWTRRADKWERGCTTVKAVAHG